MDAHGSDGPWVSARHIRNLFPDQLWIHETLVIDIFLCRDVARGQLDHRARARVGAAGIGENYAHRSQDY